MIVPKKRLFVLDAMRGLSVLAVILYHYTYRYYELYSHKDHLFFNFYDGKYGVQSFFIISGFVIFMSLNRITKAKDFVIHRFIRLYPTFWFSVIFTFIFVYIFGLPGREVSWKDMLLNLTMLAGQFNIKNVDGVYWTLLYELKFYFWIYILYLMNKIKDIDNILIFYLLVLLLSIFLEIDNFYIYKILNQLFIFDFMPYFISGIVFYKIFMGERNLKLYLILLLAFLSGFCLNNYDNAYVLFIIYTIFILLSLHKLSWLSFKPLIFIGSISYSLYLIHQNIGYIILNSGFFFNVSPILSTTIAIITSIFLATLITYYIEKPSMKFLKNRLNNSGL